MEFLTQPPYGERAEERLSPNSAATVERREAVTGYWQRYFAWRPVRFSRQVERALGVAAGHSGWERAVFAGFQETVERVAAIQGLKRWKP